MGWTTHYRHARHVNNVIEGEQNSAYLRQTSTSVGELVHVDPPNVNKSGNYSKMVLCISPSDRTGVTRRV